MGTNQEDMAAATSQHLVQRQTFSSGCASLWRHLWTDYQRLLKPGGGSRPHSPPRQGGNTPVHGAAHTPGSKRRHYAVRLTCCHAAALAHCAPSTCAHSIHLPYRFATFCGGYAHLCI